MKLHFFISLVVISALVLPIHAQIVLLGDNAPHENVNDGNFSAIWGYWRKAEQSPFWITRAVKGESEYPMGLHHGTLFSMYEVAVAESKILNTNPEYQQPLAGDVLNWSFGADLEYISDGTMTVSLVFGTYERILAEKVKLIGSDKIVEHFKGTYTVTKEDAKAGLPFVRVTFYSGEDVKVYLHYVNISVVAPKKAGPVLEVNTTGTGMQLSWTNKKIKTNTKFKIYRGRDFEKGIAYDLIGETTSNNFVDSNFITGVEYTYIVTQFDTEESAGSNKVRITKYDKEAPAPPTNLNVEVFDAELKISWTKVSDKDVKSYSIYRGDANGEKMQEIAHDIKGNKYLDFTPIKDIENTYIVFAHDFSGNKSMASKPVKAKVKMVSGASFSDLIRPMPIYKELRSDLWGAESVLPRDPDNGIEDPNWSYWGGRPVKGKEGKYHMCVTRWPANATKGHWEWPSSTVAYVMSDEPTGPYVVKKEKAYNFADGYGHNPDIILLNDGTYILYSLINWEATLFKSAAMGGPWKRLGTMTVNTETADEIPERFYRFYRNLSGVHLDDGRFLFVTKGGAMMLSEGTNPLGPYNVLTKPTEGNPIIPEKYRNSNYEDPVLWKDEVQYHMMINAFWDYRAIYLRSPDGIRWKFNPGTAYTPNNTSYEDGTQTHWYKLERPHILQDEYGRATHLSLAVIDVPKADDLARDKHSSKNLIMPLTLHKRMKMLNKTPVNIDTKSIKVLVISESGFDAQKDIDIASLRFGASEAVNYGRGAKVIKTKKKGKNLIIEFEGKGNGITKDNFVCKMLGKTKSGDLLIGFTRLSAK
ncbi:hypothetical protein [Flavivirga algicola]|uniref:Uncharacterized protein n=1 Tax=Flavivirga algicola TaxID=2729136 RepID=A0ABX1RUW5_9FLAO|nr:hypothetical protein [Flavivirga algicola]NMH86843.1 hypothetical protein [Flavivirga algicola]